MTPIHSDDLQRYLESQHNYKIVGMVDIDQLSAQPRNILFKLLRQWYKPTFENNERVVLFSRYKVSYEMLAHIQKCSCLVDVSNFFILMCGEVDHDQLEQIRKNYSSDDCVFSTLSVQFTDNHEGLLDKTVLNLPESFCFAPWAHLEISSLGEFKPCCVYKESITNSNGQAFNINTDDINSVYTSTYMQDLRQKFLDGQKPNGCDNCWYKEQHTGTSNRKWVTDYLGLDAQCLNIEQDSPDNLISLDIKLGNLCNFKCRICGPSASSRVAEEQSKYFSTSFDLKSMNRRGRWVENQNIWHMLENFGKQLVNIDFYGGEPFLIPQHETFLDFLIANNFASKIRLHYNSNGSIYPDHLFEKWKLFRQVDIAFSIDNTGQRFELERGGNWSQVEHNLDSFCNSKLPNMFLSIFCTVNVQNVYYLDQVIDWFETKQFNKLIFNLLDQPKILSITSINNDLLDVTISQLEKIPVDKRIRYSVNSIIDLLKHEKNSVESLDQLADYMLKLDSIRNQKFSQTHSEIANIIYKGKNHGQTI